MVFAPHHGLLPSQLLAPSVFTPPAKLLRPSTEAVEASAATSPLKPRKVALEDAGIATLARELWDEIFLKLFRMCKRAPALAGVDKQFKLCCVDTLQSFVGGGHPWWSGEMLPIVPPAVVSLP